MRRPMPGLLLLPLTLGCTLGEVELGGKSCPCGPGWTCDEAMDLCVEDVTGTDAGVPADAGVAADAGAEGGTDGGTDGGTKPCAQAPGVIFCDGFDDPGLGAWPVRFGSDPVGRVTDRVYRGDGALHATGGPGDILGVEVRGLPDPGTDLYMRVYVYLPTGAEQTNTQVLFAGQADPPNHGVAIGIRPPGIPYVYSNTAVIGVSAETATVPSDTWTCLQGHVVISDTDGVIETYVNGTLDAQVTGLDTRASSPYVQLAAGVTWSHNGTLGPNVWIDEVAIGTSPLPCD